MVGLNGKFLRLPAVDGAGLADQRLQPDGDFALEDALAVLGDALAVLGDENDVVAQPVRGMRAGPVAGGQRRLFVTGAAAGLLHASVYPGAAHSGGFERSAA